MIERNKLDGKISGIRWQNDPTEQHQLSAELDALQHKGLLAKLWHWWAYWTRKEGL